MRKCLVLQLESVICVEQIRRVSNSFYIALKTGKKIQTYLTPQIFLIGIIDFWSSIFKSYLENGNQSRMLQISLLFIHSLDLYVNLISVTLST